jgi:transcriptional regulator with XRE-family HTH domain
MKLRADVSSADLAAAYQEGATLADLSRRFGLGRTTVCRRLAKLGVKRRANKPRFQPASPQAHPVIKQLAAALGTADHTWPLEHAGVSPAWWADARKGRRSPNLNAVAALANAAGYELVLRRRMRG